MKANDLLKQVIEITRKESFIKEYQAKATDEECLGLALSHYFGNDGQSILKTCYNGLEDSNWHTENEVIEMLIAGKSAERMVQCIQDIEGD